MAEVLLVDDDQLIRQLLTTALQRLGCKVTPTADRDSFQRALTTQQFSLVITDADLPDDRLLTRLVSSRAHQPHAHIAVLTGHDFSASVMEGADLYADSIIKKPITLRRLEALVASIKPTPPA